MTAMTAAEKQRRYRERHRERYLAAQRERRAKDPERFAAIQKRSRLADPERFRARDKKYAVAATARLHQLKSGPCADCGRTFHPVAMDFDHVRGEKLTTVGLLRAAARDRLMDEIAKCDLVCANCHRVRTWRRRQADAADRAS